MIIERMSPLDAGFLFGENDVTHLHIGSVLVMEGPAPTFSDFRDHIAAKLPLVPRYRQVARRVPFDLGRPIWTSDRSFNLEHHVRRAALPWPGGMQELFELASHTMAQKMDAAKPLWEMCMVEGLEDDRWAVIARVHHCMADGVAGVDLLTLILDATPDAERPEPVPWCPGASPSNAELVASSLAEMATTPFRVGQAVLAGARSPRASARRLGGLVGGALSSARALTPLSATSLIGPLGRSRRWVGASVPIEDIKAVRRATGATFNDVVLAAIARGFRDVLALRGEDPDSAVRALIPVSGRPRDDRGLAVGDGTLANKVSAFFADLPLTTQDPLERLGAVAEATTKAKASGQAAAGELVEAVAGVVPAPLMSLGMRLGLKVPQRNVTLVATNVPGPQFPLFAAGRRMLRAYPYVPIAARNRLSLAVLSYDGELSIGVTGDRDSAPDVGVLTEGITIGFSELVDAAGVGRAARAGKATDGSSAPVVDLPRLVPVGA